MFHNKRTMTCAPSEQDKLYVSRSVPFQKVLLDAMYNAATTTIGYGSSDMVHSEKNHVYHAHDCRIYTNI